MFDDYLTLKSFLLNSIVGGAAVIGPVVYNILRNWPWFQQLTSILQKRVIVAVFSGVAGAILWLLSVLLQYTEMPGDYVRWAEGFWTYGVVVGLAAYTTSSFLHGYEVDKKRRVKNEVVKDEGKSL